MGWTETKPDDRETLATSHDWIAQGDEATVCRACGAAMRPGPNGLQWNGAGAIKCPANATVDPEDEE